jgi:hypothetical protein
MLDNDIAFLLQDLKTGGTANTAVLIKTLERVQHERLCMYAAMDEFEQIAGQALGYPWYKDDQKNFPGTTASDGVCIGEHVTETIVAELAANYVNLQKDRDALAMKLLQTKSLLNEQYGQQGSN